MSLNDPRLRGGASRRSGPYPLGQFPDAALRAVGKQIVHRLALGHGDITGDDFGTIFANAVGGEHRTSPLGIADVSVNGCAWSVKTVKANRPFMQEEVRLISGRNSPDYSVGIANPHTNPPNTGRAVLSIWNARVNEALDEYNELRIVVLIRNMEAKEFVLFEQEALRFTPGDFRWEFNKNENLEGFNQADNQHCFTWQPHGSQFTIKRLVPGSARHFSINRNVPILTPDTILAAIHYSDSWITIRQRPSERRG